MQIRPFGAAARRTVLIAVSGLLLVALGFSLFDGERDARQALIERFGVRAEIAGRFLATFTADVIGTEQRMAGQYLSEREPSYDSLARVSAALGFQASVLLDGSGTLLLVFPPRPELIGQDMTAQYAHLSAAVEGTITVSNVVPSAAQALPITAFAVPFDTPHGRRVFSGALAVDSTPLSEYLADLTPIANSEVYLLDGNLNLVSSNKRGVTRLSTLREENPSIETALLEADRGRYAIGEQWGRFVSVPVDGTPWHLVVAAPEEDLLSPLQGAATWTPWLLFVAVMASAATVIVVLLRLSATGAARLFETERLSTTDALTGLHNRRGFELLGNQMIRSAVRAGQQVGAIFFDLDGLKAVNDSFGHDAGDQILESFGAILRRTFRESDVTARLGGDEFAALIWTATRDDVASVRVRLEKHVQAHNATSRLGWHWPSAWVSAGSTPRFRNPWNSWSNLRTSRCTGTSGNVKLHGSKKPSTDLTPDPTGRVGQAIFSPPSAIRGEGTGGKKPPACPTREVFLASGEFDPRSFLLHFHRAMRAFGSDTYRIHPRWLVTKYRLRI